MSNASQVVLQQVGFNLSGNISCEVTTDAPSFTTAMVSKELMVIGKFYYVVSVKFTVR